MAALDKKWEHGLQACAKKGDISSIMADVKLKLTTNISATLRHGVAVELIDKFSSLLCNKKINLTPAVYHAAYQVIVLCCQATSPFDDEMQMYSFLCSLYHSIGVFFDQGMVKETLHLKKYVVLIKGKENQCSEKNASVFQSISSLYYTKIVAPLRDKYDKECTDESYFPLLDVVDDYIQLLICGGIYNLQFTLNNSQRCSKLNTKHVSEKSETRYMSHLTNVLDSVKICQGSSCELIKNSTSICQQYLFLVYLMVHRSIAKDNYTNAREVLMKINHIEPFFVSNSTLYNCVKFYKHFSEGILRIMHDGTCDIKQSLELSFDALSSVTQNPHTDEESLRVLSKVCDSARRILSCTFFKWSDASCDEWNGDMNVGVIASLHKVILEMDNVIDGIGHLDCKATDGSDCPVNSSTKYDTVLMLIVSKLVLRSMKHKMKDVHLLLPQAVLVQNTCLKHVESLKALGCVQWKSTWIKVACISYNLGYYCTKSDLKYHQNSFFSDLCDAFIKLEDLESPALTLFSLWDCLLHLVNSFKLLRKYRAALVTLVIAMAAVPKKKEAIFRQWLSFKCDKLCASKLTDVSLWKIYDKEKSILHSKYPLDFEKQIIKTEITVLELEALAACPKEDVRLKLTDALRDTASLRQDTALTARAVLALAKWTWANDDMPDEQVMKTSRATLEKTAKNSKGETADAQCILAELAFWTFLCQLKADRYRQMKEMEHGKAARIPTALADLAREAERLADVVPAYCNLDVRNELNMLGLLGTAVEISRNVIEQAHSADEIKSCSDKLRNMVEIAAWIYEAYGYDHLAIGCWGLLSKLATLTSDQATSLLALGHLLTALEYDSASSLIQSADSLAATLSRDLSKIESCDIVISYFLNKSIGCLNNGRYKEGKGALKKALDLLAGLETDETMMHVEAKLITSRYLMLPSGLVDTTDLGDDTPHVLALMALVGIKSLSRDRYYMTGCESEIMSARHRYSLGHNSRAMQLLFSTALWFAQLCIRQGFAREFVHSLPRILIAMQRQAFALRSAQILSAFAYMDLLCEKLDCQVKIHGMENITLLGKSVGCARVVSRKEPGQKATVKEISNTPTFRRLQLSRDSAFSCRSPAKVSQSPVFKPVPFTAPDFVSHDIGCTCMYCESPGIQNAAFDIACLQARFYALHGNSVQTLEFFKGAMHIHKNLLEKQNYVFNRLADQVSTDFELALHLQKDTGSWKCSLLRIKLHTDFSYIDFHTRHNLIEKSLQLNQMLTTSLKEVPFVGGFLFPEVLDQKFDLKRSSENQKPTQNGACASAETNVVRKSIGRAVAETPLGPSKISFTKTAKRPFRIFAELSPNVRPRPPLLNLKSPLPDIVSSVLPNPISRPTPAPKSQPGQPSVSDKQGQNKKIRGVTTSEKTPFAQPTNKTFIPNSEEDVSPIELESDGKVQAPLTVGSSIIPSMGANEYSAHVKTVAHSDAILQNLMAELEYSADDSGDIVEPSPKVIPTTQRKRKPVAGLTTKGKSKTNTESDNVSEVKTDNRLNTAQSNTLIPPTKDDKELSPSMPEAKKKLLFNSGEQAVLSSRSKNLGKEKTGVTAKPQKMDKKEAINLKSNRPKTKVEKATKPQVRGRTDRLAASTDSCESGNINVEMKHRIPSRQITDLVQNIKVEEEGNIANQKTAIYRHKLMDDANGSSAASSIKTEKLTRQPEKRQEALTDRESTYDSMNLKGKASKKVPAKVHESSSIRARTESTRTRKLASKNPVDVLQTKGLQQQTKIEEENTEIHKLTKSRAGQTDIEAAAPVKSKKISRPTEKQLKVLEEQGSSGDFTHPKCNGAKAKAEKVTKQVRSRASTLAVSSDSSGGESTKVATSNLKSSLQIAGKLQKTKPWAEENEENQKPTSRLASKSKMALKFEIDASSASSDDCTDIIRFKRKVNVNNVLRSPLKAGLENVSAPISPVKTRRGRKVIR